MHRKQVVLAHSAVVELVAVATEHIVIAIAHTADCIVLVLVGHKEQDCRQLREEDTQKLKQGQGRLVEWKEAGNPRQDRKSKESSKQQRQKK